MLSYLLFQTPALSIAAAVLSVLISAACLYYILYDIYPALDRLRTGAKAAAGGVESMSAVAATTARAQWPSDPQAVAGAKGGGGGGGGGGRPAAGDDAGVPPWPFAAGTAAATAPAPP